MHVVSNSGNGTAPRGRASVDCPFTLDGMREAEHKHAAVYKKMDASDRCVCTYYDGPQSFKVSAQDDAIAWLERWLR